MADIIGEDDIAQLMEAFNQFDLDNDGLINTNELRWLLRSTVNSRLLHT